MSEDLLKQLEEITIDAGKLINNLDNIQIMKILKS